MGWFRGPKRTSQVVLVVKNLLASESIRDMDSVPGLGKSPRGGHGNPPQYSCLENHKVRGACLVIVHKVAKDLDMTEVT